MIKKQIGLIAHRGYSSKYPHNTLDAFEAALAFEPIGIEMDVVIFEDQLYLYHPISHKSSYGKDVDLVIQKELAELKQLDQLKNHSLDEKILSLLNHTQFLLLDLKQKNQAIIPQFIQAVRSFGINKDQLVVGARDQKKLELINPHISIFNILSLSSQPDSYTDFIEQGVDFIRLWDDDVSSKKIDAIHQLGSQVWVTPGYPTSPERKGTGGEITPEKLLKIQDMGVDAVLVNDIKMARETLDNYQGQ